MKFKFLPSAKSEKEKLPQAAFRMYRGMLTYLPERSVLRASSAALYPLFYC